MRPNDVMTSLAWAFRERREAWKIGQNVHTGKSLRLSLIRRPMSATAILHGNFQECNLFKSRDLIARFSSHSPLYSRKGNPIITLLEKVTLWGGIVMWRAANWMWRASEGVQDRGPRVETFLRVTLQMFAYNLC